MEKFKSFITEQKEEPYKLVMFHNSHEHLRDVGKQDAPDYKLMTKAANTVGVDLFHAEFQGSRIEEKGDKLFLHSFAFDDKTGLSIKIEQRNIEELTYFEKKRISNSKKASNPAFDITPKSLISGIITEKGIIRNPNLIKINKFKNRYITQPKKN